LRIGRANVCENVVALCKLHTVFQPVTQLSTFVRITGARWLWPLLALVLLTELWLARMAAAGNPTVFVLAALLLSSAGLVGTVVLVHRLTGLVGEAEDAREADEVTHLRLREAQAQAQAADKRLREAIDAMPSGFAIYDGSNTLIACNSQAPQMFFHLNCDQPVGKTHENLLRQALDKGLIPYAVGQETQWLAARLAKRGKLDGPVLKSNGAGRWLQHHETRTLSGDLVLVRLDVTELVEKSLALERANVQLAHLSTTDGLTGIANRRLFDQTLLAEWQRSARSQQPLSLLMVDIDHFKRYNDHYGHLAGDDCLRRVARILESCVMRSGELVARYGGEEFALLLPGTDAHEANVVARRCHDELQKACISHANSPASPWLGISIGVASATATQDSLPETLLGSADTALYRAKDNGRGGIETMPADLALL
jgi:diguanylate cyclase (GGDEF)-like protein